MSDSKEVTRLRKAGQIKEALALARHLHKENPNDPYILRAYGWTLYYVIKKIADSNLQITKQLVSEFNKLTLPDDGEIDKKLIAQREYYTARIEDPSSGLLQQAKAKSKNQEYSEALRLYRQAVRLHPNSEEACKGLAWELWRSLKNLPNEATEAQITPVLREYAQLTSIEKPSEIHSRILGLATRYADKFSQYISFVKWWNIRNLRLEDRKKQYNENNDMHYDSLTERLIKALHKAGKNHKVLDDFVWISEFIGYYYKLFPDQEWFPYYYCKALVKIGNLEAARETVLPIVRAKQSEFWAWDVLASTFDDSDSKKACLCKALLCKVKSDSFRVNIHCELADLLKSEGSLAEAKKEYLSAIAIRKNEDWKLTPELDTVCQETWFNDTETTENNSGTYKEYAPKAERILTESLPWIEAVVTGKRKRTDNKKPLVFIGTRKGQHIDEVPVHPEKFPTLLDISEGDTVSIKADSFGDRCIVVAIEPRVGDKWDIFLSYDGVVSHLNPNKGIAHVTIAKNSFCLLHFDKFPEARKLSVGDFIRVKIKNFMQKEISHAVSFTFIDKLPEVSDYYKVFSGLIHLNDGNSFGFVEDYYVSPSIVKDLDLKDGDYVSGVGVCEWNQKKQKYSWSAIVIERPDITQND